MAKDQTTKPTGRGDAGDRPVTRVIGEWTNLHLWQIQPVRDVLVVAAVFGIVQLGYMLRLVTVPLLLAMLLAYLFEPIVQKLTKKFAWMSRNFAAGAIIATVALVIVIPATIAISFGVVQAAGFVARASNSAIHLYEFLDHARLNPLWAPDQSAEEFLATQPAEAREAYESLPEGFWNTAAQFMASNVDVKNEVIQWMGEQAGDDAEFEDWARQNAGKAASILTRGAIGSLSFVIGTATAIGFIAFQLFLTAFFFFFFSSGYGKVLAFWESLIPEKRKSKVVDLVRQMDGVIAGFIRGRLTIALIQAGVFAIGYFLAGVPAAFILGIAVGILSIVPYLALIGIPVSLSLIFLDPPEGFRSAWWWMTFAPVAIYFIGQALDDYVLTPMIQGKSTDMDTPTVLFASLAGGVLGGVYGLLVAIPVAACLKIVIREVLWPKVQEWAQGRAKDPLPLGQKDGAE